MVFIVQFFQCFLFKKVYNKELRKIISTQFACGLPGRTWSREGDTGDVADWGSGR